MKVVSIPVKRDARGLKGGLNEARELLFDWSLPVEEKDVLTEFIQFLQPGAMHLRFEDVAAHLV